MRTIEHARAAAADGQPLSEPGWREFRTQASAMSDPLLTVSAAGLRAAGVTLSSAEAVACVLLTGEALQWSTSAPDPSRVILRGDGRIHVIAPPVAASEPASVESYARLLHRLLPDAGDGSLTPGALRLTVARGLGALDAPPFASLEDFRVGIARFLTQSPEEHIVAAVVRWAEVMGSQSDDHFPERRVSGPRVDTLRRFLREADLERYALAKGKGASAASAAVVDTMRGTADVRTPAPPADVVERPVPVVLSTLDPVPERPVRWRAFAAVAVLAAVVGWAAAHFVRDGAAPFSSEQLRTAIAGDEELGTPDAARGILSPEPGTAPGTRHTERGTAETATAVGSGGAESAIGGTGTSVTAEGEHAQALGGSSTVAAAEPASTAGASVDADGLADASAAHASEAGITSGGGDGASSSATAMTDRTLPSYWPSGTDDRTVIDAGMVTYSGFRLANVIDGEYQTAHVRLSPDGTRVAFDSDRDGERGVYVARRDGTGVRRISGNGFAEAPAWSPDSGRIAFLREEEDNPQVRNLWVINLETGEERRLTAWRHGVMSPADWFSDGRRLSYAHDGKLYVMDLESGASRSYDSPVPGRGIGAISVSPEGRRIAFSVVNDGVWLLDLAKGSMRRVLNDPTIKQLAWSPTGTSLAYHTAPGHWAVLMLSHH